MYDSVENIAHQSFRAYKIQKSTISIDTKQNYPIDQSHDFPMQTQTIHHIRVPTIGLQNNYDRFSPRVRRFPRPADIEIQERTQDGRTLGSHLNVDCAACFHIPRVKSRLSRPLSRIISARKIPRRKGKSFPLSL